MHTTIKRSALALCAFALATVMFLMSAPQAHALSYAYPNYGYYPYNNYGYYGYPIYNYGYYYNTWSYGWSGWGYNRVYYNYHYPYNTYNYYNYPSYGYGGYWNMHYMYNVYPVAVAYPYPGYYW